MAQGQDQNRTGPAKGRQQDQQNGGQASRTRTRDRQQGGEQHGPGQRAGARASASSNRTAARPRRTSRSSRSRTSSASRAAPARTRSARTSRASAETLFHVRQRGMAPLFLWGPLKLRACDTAADDVLQFWRERDRGARSRRCASTRTSASASSRPTRPPLPERCSNGAPPRTGRSPSSCCWTSSPATPSAARPACMRPIPRPAPRPMRRSAPASTRRSTRSCASSSICPSCIRKRIEDLDRSVALNEAVGGESLRYALHHREIVRRFGRFPHRNAALGQEQFRGRGALPGRRRLLRLAVDVDGRSSAAGQPSEERSSSGILEVGRVAGRPGRGGRPSDP